MSRGGAIAKREARRQTAKQIRYGIEPKPRPGGNGLSYVDLHELACGCSHDRGDGDGYCTFGDGWLGAE